MSKSAPALAVAGFVLAMGSLPVRAQPYPAGFPRPAPGEFVIVNRNNTGGDVNVIIPRGATGAETFMSDSAAAGNAARPELAVPNGSSGGGGGGTR